MPTQMPTLTLAMCDISRAATVRPFLRRQIWYMRGYDEQVIDFILRDGGIGEVQLRLQPKVSLRANPIKCRQIFQIRFVQLPLERRKAGTGEKIFAEPADKLVGSAGEKGFQSRNQIPQWSGAIQIEHDAIRSAGANQARRKFRPQGTALESPE